jgi:hypothetical protein
METTEEIPEKDRNKDLRGLSPSELEFFRNIVEKLVTDPQLCGSMDYMKAMNMRSS